MTALPLLLQLVAPAPAAPAAMPPADWSALPDLPVASPRAEFDPSGYVRREVAAGRCKAVPGAGESRVAASVAVLVDARGGVQRIVPQAIGCPTVEQFTVGYVSTLARRAALAERTLKPGWYRHVVTYRWTG